jgi:hypothetical protein
VNPAASGSDFSGSSYAAVNRVNSRIRSWQWAMVGLPLRSRVMPSRSRRFSSTFRIYYLSANPVSSSKMFLAAASNFFDQHDNHAIRIGRASNR